MTQMEFLEGMRKPWMFLAPMVSNSEEAYRLLARRYGADLCFTEMINSRVFLESAKKKKFATRKEDRPLAAQICGSDPQTMLAAALILQEHCDAIDINFGCPQEIARRGHYGAFLQDEWNLISKIVSLLSSSLRVPLFCKIRIFDSIEKTVEYARLFERSGCALLTVHGRTREQRGQLTGMASWDHIRAVKEALHIPVIANGNMIYHHNIRECIEYTKCDGVMIAEPHLYNPTIFTDLSVSSVDIFLEYLEICKEYPGSSEHKHIKSHAFKILKTLLQFHPELLPHLDKCSSLKEFQDFTRRLQQRNYPTEVYLLKPYIRKTD